MKRIIAVAVMLMLFVCLASPAFAAEFVPSITDKNSPDVVPGENGVGDILDPVGNIVISIPEGALIVTPVSKVEISEDIPADSKTTLKELYDALVNGEMKLPFPNDIDAADMVIRDLFDVSVQGENFQQHLTGTGNSLSVIFDLGVDKNTVVHGFIHMDGKWIALENLKNNGNGTVTVTLPGEGQVAFAVDADSNTIPDPTGDNAQITLWIVLMAVSAVALAVVVFSRRKIAG